MFHPMTSVLGAACCSTRSCCQELIRNRGFMRNRKQHTGMLLLDVPCHQPSTVTRYVSFLPNLQRTGGAEQSDFPELLCL